MPDLINNPKIIVFSLELNHKFSDTTKKQQSHYGHVGLYFISEDDGNWFINEKDKYNIGLQSSFSIGWADSFVKALENLSKYVEENGVPVRYQLGTDKDGNQIYGDICNYRLE